MPNSYEHSYQHDLDNVIDASDAVLAIGTEKVDTTTLKDRSLNNNDATIHEAMPSSGYFLGRRFDSNNDYIGVGSVSDIQYASGSIFSGLFIVNNFDVTGEFTYLGQDAPGFMFQVRNTFLEFFYNVGLTVAISTLDIDTNVINIIGFTYNDTTGECTFYRNGTSQTISTPANSLEKGGSAYIGKYASAGRELDGILFTCFIKNNDVMTVAEFNSIFNTLARLPLYSHNFERYPNSDTSLTSIFPYTSGIITSGSFNKTNGLKCTSAGQIICSNSFEFDGSEYVTLTIDGVEYSGTTTVTQGTITATIAQGSNDITIDMDTNDVLEDIQIQFRSEV